ncbi:hypothetical protein NFI96_024168 [Prochilodus magdalenae]|nr:hypothetical protein NFI96_024168 [Prochilodus magdalenae]
MGKLALRLILRLAYRGARLVDVVLVLQRYVCLNTSVPVFLCRFTKNLSPDKINLSTLKGEGQLSNLELDEEVLQNMLDLPTWLAVTRVYCNKAAIRIQWTKLKTSPICLFLDKVEVEMRTCEEPRPPNGPSPIAITAGQSEYGFAEKVVEGMSVIINSITIKVQARAFHASFELWQLQGYSLNPKWQKTDLRYTRITHPKRGEVLTFKEINWQSLRIEADAIESEDQDLGSTPLRLITNQGRIRIALKRRVKDCNVLASKLLFILDDLLWVLTDSQLKAVIHYAKSLSEAMEKSAQQRKSMAAESLQLRMYDFVFQTAPPSPGPHPLWTEPPPPPVGTPSTLAQYFDLHDVKESSYHTFISRLDLHICNDSSSADPDDPSVPGSQGAMQLTFRKLGCDYYPFHRPGTGSVTAERAMDSRAQCLGGQTTAEFQQKGGRFQASPGPTTDQKTPAHSQPARKSQGVRHRGPTQVSLTAVLTVNPSHDQRTAAPRTFVGRWGIRFQIYSPVLKWAISDDRWDRKCSKTTGTSVQPMHGDLPGGRSGHPPGWVDEMKRWSKVTHGNIFNDFVLSVCKKFKSPGGYRYLYSGKVSTVDTDHKVSTGGRNSKRTQSLLSCNRKSLQLAENTPAIHLQFTEYYFPHSPGTPGPPQDHHRAGMMWEVDHSQHCSDTDVVVVLVCVVLVWTVRDDSSSAAAQCSVGHPLDTGRCPTGHYLQDAAHRTLPTGRCPQDTTHRMLPTGHHPGRWPRGRCPTGRCPTGRCPTGRCPTGRCPRGRLPRGRLPRGRLPRGSCTTGSCTTGSCTTGSCPRGYCPLDSFVPCSNLYGQLNGLQLCVDAPSLLWMAWFSRGLLRTLEQVKAFYHLQDSSKSEEHVDVRVDVTQLKTDGNTGPCEPLLLLMLCRLSSCLPVAAGSSGLLHLGSPGSSPVSELHPPPGHTEQPPSHCPHGSRSDLQGIFTSFSKRPFFQTSPSPPFPRDRNTFHPLPPGFLHPSSEKRPSRAQDMWCLSLSRAALGFEGARRGPKGKALPFVEPFAMSVWVCRPNALTATGSDPEAPRMPDEQPQPGANHVLPGHTDPEVPEAPSAPVHILAQSITPVKVWLNHYQYVALLRMKDFLARLAGDLTHDPQGSHGSEKKLADPPAVCASVLLEAIELGLLLPPTVGEPEEDGVSPEETDSQSLTDSEMSPSHRVREPGLLQDSDAGESTAANAAGSHDQEDEGDGEGEGSVEEACEAIEETDDQVGQDEPQPAALVTTPPPSPALTRDTSTFSLEGELSNALSATKDVTKDALNASLDLTKGALSITKDAFSILSRGSAMTKLFSTQTKEQAARQDDSSLRLQPIKHSPSQNSCDSALLDSSVADDGLSVDSDTSENFIILLDSESGLESMRPNGTPVHSGSRVSPAAGGRALADSWGGSSADLSSSLSQSIEDLSQDSVSVLLLSLTGVTSVMELRGEDAVVATEAQYLTPKQLGNQRVTELLAGLTLAQGEDEWLSPACSPSAV